MRGREGLVGVVRWLHCRWMQRQMMRLTEQTENDCQQMHCEPKSLDGSDGDGFLVLNAKPDILVHGNSCATFLEAFTQQLFHQSDDKQMVFLKKNDEENIKR